jgi:hypothetical protein
VRDVAAATGGAVRDQLRPPGNGRQQRDLQAGPADGLEASSGARDHQRQMCDPAQENGGTGSIGPGPTGHGPGSSRSSSATIATLGSTGPGLTSTSAGRRPSSTA